MLAKLIVSFFSLNGPILLLLFFTTVYLGLALKLRRMLNSSNVNLQSRLPFIDAKLLEKLLRSSLIEKSNIILNSVLIGVHLLLLLVSLLLVSNLHSHASGYLALTGNVSVPTVGFSSNYQALINSKKQAEELRSYCKANRLNSICEINDQINQQISQKLENWRTHQKLDKNDLKENDLNEKVNDLMKVCTKEEFWQNSNKKSGKKSDKSDLFNNFYFTELDKLLSGQIGATSAFIGIIAILLSLAHYADTLMAAVLEFKINKLIKNPNVNYRELNRTHIVERVLTPFAIYLDFKHFDSPTYLWFTISWSLLDIVSRLSYLRRLSNEKRFQTTLILNDLLKAKVIFYSLFLLLSSYLMSLSELSSTGRLPDSVKIFNLFYSLLLFLQTLSDYERVLNQENRSINLDLNNNKVTSRNGRLQANMTSFNTFNTFNKCNHHSRSTSSILQPVCNDLSRRY